jgi:hypothetical protein
MVSPPSRARDPIMHRATPSPYVTAGIAVLGAGLIALPAAAALLVDLSALPSVKVADVLLTSTDQDAAADAVGALANFTPDALTTPDLNIAISFDGVTLLHEGTATAFSDPGDFAIAIGAQSYASATGGLLESAIAVGTNDTETTADAYGGNLNTAFATNGGDATATTGNFESAVANSGFADAYGGNGNSAYASNGGDASATHGDFMSAYASGTNADADSYNGTGEMTSATGAGSSAFAEDGNYDSAIVNGAGTTAEAENGNSELASVFNLTGTGGSADADWGNGNEALVFGDSTASAGGTSADLGNYDIASAFGNLDHVLAGANMLDNVGSFDLGAVFGDGLSSSGATGANWLVEILPSI